MGWAAGTFSLFVRLCAAAMASARDMALEFERRQQLCNFDFGALIVEARQLNNQPRETSSKIEPPGRPWGGDI